MKIDILTGMTKEDIQVALQNLYQVLTDKGFTDTATAINCAEDTLMDDEGYDWKDFNYPDLSKYAKYEED